MILPAWALDKAGVKDRERSERAFQQSRAKVIFVNRSGLRRWMKDKYWKTSWFVLEHSFYKSFFASDENFALALTENVVELYIPKSSYRISKEQLEEIDRDYEEQSWSYSVEALREIRRAIDAGVVIEIGDKTFRSSGSFYTWAHKRYHLLEEMSDQWILDDR